MKEAIDFFADFKEEALFHPISSLGIWSGVRSRLDLWALGGIQRGRGEIREEAESSRMRIVVVVCVCRRGGGEEQEVWK